MDIELKGTIPEMIEDLIELKEFLIRIYNIQDNDIKNEIDESIKDIDEKLEMLESME